MVTEDAQVGLSWDKGDTALTIMNPAYGIFRLFGGRSPTSGGDDEPAATTTMSDVTKTPAYQTLLKRVQDAQAKAIAAEQRQAEAARALQALRTAPPSTFSPIAVTVPSFSLGGRAGRCW